MNSVDKGDGVRGEARLSLGLRHGGRPELTLRYEILGRGPNALFVTGGISAGRHVIADDRFPEPGWWQAQAASFDLDRYRLLSFDWVGAEGDIDRPIDPADQAEAIASLLDRLEIKRLRAFIGSSYGGMVGMHLAALHPTVSEPCWRSARPAPPTPFPARTGLCSAGRWPWARRRAIRRRA